MFLTNLYKLNNNIYIIVFLLSLMVKRKKDLFDIRILIISIFIVGTFLFFIGLNIFIGKNKCVDYKLEVLSHNFLEESKLINDCPNIEGATHEGELKVEIQLSNENNINLGIPCNMTFTKKLSETKTGFLQSNFSFFIGAQSTEQKTLIVEFPECFTGWTVNCKSVSEIPECSNWFW